MSVDLRSALQSLSREALPAGDATAAVSASKRATRRRALLAVPVAAVVALAVVSLAVAVQGERAVQPADGPGSLPDRIFPVGSRMLTLDQAPIGRIAMVYAQPVVGRASSWVAVGADADSYRFVAPFSGGGDSPLDVAPDGTAVAVGVTAEQAASCRVDLVAATTGTTRSVTLPNVPLGCSIDSLRFSPDGRELVVGATRVTARDGSGWSGSAAWFLVTEKVGVVELGHRAFDELVGWDATTPVVAGQRSDNGPPRPSLIRLEVERPLSGATTSYPGTSPWSLSPDGQLIAVLPDPSSTVSHSVEPRRLQVYDTTNGQRLRVVRLGLTSGDSAQVVGWRDDTTPVVSWRPVVKDALGDPTAADGRIVAYPATGEPVVLTLAARDSQFSFVRLAQEVLRSGEVRSATPPDQAWYDPRTLLPDVWGWTRWPLLGFGVLLALALGGLVVGRSRSRRSG